MSTPATAAAQEALDTIAAELARAVETGALPSGRGAGRTAWTLLATGYPDGTVDVTVLAGGIKLASARRRAAPRGDAS